jgi:aromatic-L-amino-acid/L-tryptophan decarboxylase
MADSALRAGDMPPAEFARHAAELASWIAAYFEGVEQLPVLARVEPGEVRATLPDSLPEHGEPMERILADFRADLLPGVTHWNHPSFFAYFAISGSAPGVLGEMLAAALNVNAMLWRTGPAATELEERSLDWLRQLIGLPAGFSGVIQDTASISTLAALAAARHRAFPAAREAGLAGGPRLRLYCSEEAHSSVSKAAITLGLGLEGARRIPVDERFRLRPDLLEAAIRADLAAGDLPFCVVATVGTTSTTAVDPLPELASICRRHRLWLHVDAAYGGAAAILPEMRHVLDGAAEADSLVVNPHKWLFVPVDCSALFLRDASPLRDALSLVPEYLRTPEPDAARNLMDYGPALGRRFRALKLWMVLRYFGRAGLQDRIREHIRLARGFAARVDAAPDWERLAPADFSVVAFRYRPAGFDDEAALDRINEAILERVNRSGDAFLSHTRVRGRFALRLAVGNLRTTAEHVDRAWRLLVRESALAAAG